MFPCGRLTFTLRDFCHRSQVAVKAGARQRPVYPRPPTWLQLEPISSSLEAFSKAPSPNQKDRPPRAGPIGACGNEPCSSVASFSRVRGLRWEIFGDDCGIDLGDGAVR